MTTQIEIANLALSHLGHARTINDINEASHEARSVRAFWQSSVDSVMQAHRWRFAETKAYLSVLAEDYFDHRFIYDYPSDCLDLYELRIKDYREPIPYALCSYNDTQAIGCNEAEVYAIYTKILTNYNYPPHVGAAIASKLAINLRSALASDSDTKKLYEIYMMDLSKAMTIDANQHKGSVNNYINPIQMVRNRGVANGLYPAKLYQR